MPTENPDLQAHISDAWAALSKAIDAAKRDRPDDLGDLLRTAYMLDDLSHIAGAAHPPTDPAPF